MLMGRSAVIGLNGTLRDGNRMAHALGFATPEASSMLEHRDPGNQILLRAARIESVDPIKPHGKTARLQPGRVSQSYGPHP